MTAELPGFKVFERAGTTIGTQEFLTIDIRLESRLGHRVRCCWTYQLAPAYTFGDMARNVADIRTPRQTNLNLSMEKTTNITERVKVTPRLEANNATNTAKFGGPANLSNTTFGTITTQVGFSRQLQWMARVHW